jgi:hypothetical protein
VAPATLRGDPLSPGPSLTQARRAVTLFKSRIGTFCYPQDTLLISRLLSREIRVRDIAKLLDTILVQIKPRTLMAKESMVPSFRGFPYREIGECDVAIHSPSKSMNLELRWHIRYLSPCHLLSRLYRESRDRDFTSRNSFATRVSKCRILTSWDLAPHASVAINGSDQIGESLLSDFNEYELLPRQTPKAKPRCAEIRWPIPSCA